MDDFVRVSVCTVETFFGQTCGFHLPWFQRAYAWREDNVSRFFCDIVAAMDSPKPRYSLGHVHVAGPRSSKSLAIIDGHQRAITLTMLFAILRDATAADETLPETERQPVLGRLAPLLWIEAEADTETGTERDTLRWRLHAQPQISGFFEQYVQLPGATLLEPPGNLANLTQTERNLIANRDKLQSLLSAENFSSARRSRLAEFLLTGCHLIVVNVDDEDEAWSMLGIEQSTRLPHDNSELAKIALIYAMPPKEQEPAGRIWETAQEQIGTARMTELMAHLRSAKLDKRSTKPVEADLQQSYALNRNGLAFMTNVVQPNVDALRRIDARQVGTGLLAGAIGRHLEVLSWLDHRHWVSPAMVWLTTKSDQHPETEQFFARLDRLAWLLRLAGTDPNEQESRFIRLTTAVRRDTAIAGWPELSVSSAIVDAALKILRSRTFYYKHMCNRVLRRLCFQLGHDPGPIDGVKVSIEHVLPRNPPPARKWAEDFATEAIVDAFADRLGNLALLTGPQNRKADTNDWPIKREILKVSGFALSIEAISHAKWTSKTIETRTEKLIKQLFSEWELPVKK
jgi:Protein of unknown function (DUF1524)/Protein of unknown function DUF262